MERKLARSRKDKMLGGVCGGFAEYFCWASWMVRFAYVLISILSAAFPGILIYILLWIFMPLKAEE
ncbi:MAG: PspC domain-containing protein [Geobacteraceae bacterium]|nr:PspC domain-containing protein [Geobacteraceae bacterium]